MDADGHIRELTPVLLDYIEQIGGSQALQRFASAFDKLRGRWFRMSAEERRDTWTPCPGWWGGPPSTYDRATASLPRLLSERMDDLGIDFAVLYPTQGITLPDIPDEEARRVACRALNAYLAGVYGEYADRMTPAAAIPMDTPQEAIEELEYAVKVLGLKVMMFGRVVRPIPKVLREHPEMAEVAYRLDTFGIDSDHDYDPVWAKCVELGVAPTSHLGGLGWGSRRSISNYMYNHIGHFAAAGEAMCKSLFMGSVTRRFPTLKFAFLECGVAWACSLYADLIGHWEKRNAKAIQALDPANLDRELMMRLIARYGNSRFTAKMEELRDSFSRGQARPPQVDDWAPCGIEKVEEIRDLFVPRFYFGCEADDPMNAWAFNAKINPFGARLRAILSSDLGHWDVPDIREVVAEAYQSVERGLITEGDFQDFVFTNPVTLYGSLNPGFFKGTRIEAEVAQVLARV